MGVTTLRDAWSQLVFQIKSRDYFRLKELQHEHDIKGRRTSFTMLDSCEGVWLLTVKPNEL